MAATNTSDSTGRVNYYNIAYGMLCTNAKQAPEGYEEIKLAELKSKTQKVEKIDLRKKFYDTENGKDYPLKVFYTEISGIIENVEKEKFDKGTTLKVTLHDSDGDESILQTKFYGKVSADFLNRLLNVNAENSLVFRPYSIPTSAEIGGKNISFYNSGVSIKDDGKKTERAFNKDNGLPATEQVKNTQGDTETSRVDQIDFLWGKVQEKFSDLPEREAPKTETQPTQEAKKEEPKKEAAKKTAETTSSATSDLPF